MDSSHNLLRIDWTGSTGLKYRMTTFSKSLRLAEPLN